MKGPNGERVSASAFERAEKCLFPWVANPNQHPWDRSSGKAAKVGTAVHHLIEAHISKLSQALRPRWISDADVKEAAPYFATWRNWWSDVSDAYDGYTAEVKLWYTGNGEAGASTSGEARDYAKLKDDALVGTADLWSDSEVIDWKTGRYPVDPTTAQMALLALMTHKAKGKPTVTATIVQLSPWKAPDVRSHKYDAFELLSIESRVDEVRHRLAANATEPTPGEAQCRFCPIKKTCPAIK